MILLKSHGLWNQFYLLMIVTFVQVTKDLNVLNDRINSRVCKISGWFKINKQTLNIKKTNFILFTTKKIKKPIVVQIDGINVEQVNEFKFLGVIITNKLSWDSHIKTIRNKASKSIGIICKVSKNMPWSILRNLYFTLVHPHFEYCNVI